MLIAALAVAPPLRAEPSPSGGAAEAPSPTTNASIQEDTENRRAALAVELAAAERRSETAPGADREQAQRELAVLQRLDLVYGQQLAAIRRGAELAAARTGAEQEFADARAKDASAKARASFATLEAARDELDLEQARGPAITARVQAAEDALAQAREMFDESERVRREAQEAVEGTPQPGQPLTPGQTLAEAVIESRLGAEKVRLRELELANERLGPPLHELRLAALQERVSRLGAQVPFGSKDLQDQLAKLDKEEVDLAQAAATAKLTLESSQRALTRSRTRQGRAPDGDPVLNEEVVARALAQQTAQMSVTTIQQRLQLVAELKTVWNRRYRIASRTATRAELSAWASAVNQMLEQLERDVRLESARAGDIRTQASAYVQKVEGGSGPALPWQREQLQHVQEQIRLLEGHLAHLEAVRLLERRLQQEVNARAAALPMRERLGAAWESLQGVWRYEIFAIDDRPITVGKIIAGLLLFGVGIRFSGLLSRLLGRRVFPRLGLHAGAATALQTLSFYVFVILMTLFALRVINIPLTVFTLAGGAVAIGVGFGSQNIANNFISGIILLAEQPIRIGDMIELDGVLATVEHIGPRSTRVRSASGTQIVVPNSSFLDKHVVNLTLSDDHVRTSIRVGVAYGSPAREVARLLRRAADEHPRVLQAPEPTVNLADFGDSAMVFDLNVSMRIRTLADRRAIESDLRFAIDALFREAGVSIPFPQRDVHVDTTRPLRVSVERDAPE